MSEKRKSILYIIIVLAVLGIIGLILVLALSRANTEEYPSSVAIQTEQEVIVTDAEPIQALTINAPVQPLPAEDRMITTVPETVQNSEPIQTLPALQ